MTNNNGSNGKVSQNINVGNGNGKAKPNQTAILPQNPTSRQKIENFEQQVILKQTNFWSRAIAWTIIGVSTFGLLWASFAKIEQVVNAAGQLEPVGTVKEVKPPINGVVKEVLVEDGDQVEQGQVLIIFDSDASEAELVALQEIQRSLTQENQFYRTLLNEAVSESERETAIIRLDLPPEIANLSRNLSELNAENEMLNFYLDPNTVAETALSPTTQARLRAIRAEYSSRSDSSNLEIGQLERQLAQNALQLTDAQAKLATDQQVLAEIKERNRIAIAKAEESLTIDEGILTDIEPLVEEGALARLQLQQQRQQVNDRFKDVVEQRANGTIEYNNQQQQVQTRLAEIDQLLEEKQRLQLAVAQGQADSTNVTALSETNIREQLATNEQRIADLESQLTKLIVENDKNIAENASQISRAEQTLKYQELRAPVAGTVFDLQAFPGFVPQPSQAEVLLKIVPDDSLVAKVYITNKDIGFVRENMNTDVRIDSFPFSEFGDIKGEVIWIGSDALPPDQFNQYYRFPVKIKLDTQYLEINDRQLSLQSGMSVSANIKVRENRTVLSLVTELFTEKTDTLKQVR
ncbi:HlyD family efflux transporter periplasmic adaptor subunit [Gloeocapsa sp. PCC 73106]|uniref:HlyD family efflux transporter periplasmic adaptor subunit n=1 Tax=Gloeocapsa sp. PCC 73106 TaxID=102232 RepID=UPI0002ACD0D4|nr:HlyD family efflux transporter periplasmic adaptor subunit [Gloeocapsa sp. PCC 73106]ELR97183.1 multidrug resistance efflux pump [Gloeocapsa sp. PCC 73106]